MTRHPFTGLLVHEPKPVADLRRNDVNELLALKACMRRLRELAAKLPNDAELGQAVRALIGGER